MISDLGQWFRHADSTEMAWVVGLLILLGLGALFGFLHFSKRLRLIADTPTALIRSAPQGFVQLEGLSNWLPGPQIIAPLTHQPCIWYRFRIEEVKGSGRNRRRTLVEEGVSHDLFVLRDETGECIVDPDGAKVINPEVDQWRSSALSHNFGPGAGSSWFSSGRYHYREERLHAHQSLLVLGEFSTAYHEGPSRAERIRDLLRDWKNDPMIIQQFDVDQDGKLSLEEWDAVRAEAERKVVSDMAAEPQPDAFNLVRRGGPGTQRLLVLSSLTETQLVKRYRIWSYSYALVGVLALSIAVWGYSING